MKEKKLDLIHELLSKSDIVMLRTSVVGTLLRSLRRKIQEAIGAKRTKAYFSPRRV